MSMKPSPRLFIRKIVIILAVVSLVLIAGSFAATPKKKILYTFTNQTDGGVPSGGLVSGIQGVLYGTAASGGSSDCSDFGACGVIFSLAPPLASGSWTETPIYTFQNAADPYGPTTGLVMDSHGNLYGSVEWEIFQLAPGASGGWTYNVVFDNYPNVSPLPEPAVDAADNVYSQYTLVYESSPTSTGSWTTNTIYTAGGRSSLIVDKTGTLYGTDSGGGIDNLGVVFSLVPQSDGSWQYNTLYEFTNEETGAIPETGLAIDTKGNLYGTAEITNSKCLAFAGCGIVFELSPPAIEGGQWHERPCTYLKAEKTALF